MMKCKYCGGNLTLEQAYCPHCGRPNEEAAQHVKDMEHYKSNFEDTKSDVYEVAEKNTEIMSHMIIITVLVILCVVVFVVSARSWSIHRGLLQFDAGIRQSSYMKQMEQYLEDEDYIGLSAFCDRHYIRPYSSNNSYEKYQLLMEASGAYRYFYESLMKAVTINSGNVSILPGLYEDISDYYEQLERILHPVDNDYRAKQYRAASAAGGTVPRSWAARAGGSPSASCSCSPAPQILQVTPTHHTHPNQASCSDIACSCAA